MQVNTVFAMSIPKPNFDEEENTEEVDLSPAVGDPAEEVDLSPAIGDPAEDPAEDPADEDDPLDDFLNDEDDDQDETDEQTNDDNEIINDENTDEDLDEDEEIIEEEFVNDQFFNNNLRPAADQFINTGQVAQTGPGFLLSLIPAISYLGLKRKK